jgi:MYND finger.
MSLEFARGSSIDDMIGMLSGQLPVTRISSCQPFVSLQSLVSTVKTDLPWSAEDCVTHALEYKGVHPDSVRLVVKHLYERKQAGSTLLQLTEGSMEFGTNPDEHIKTLLVRTAQVKMPTNGPVVLQQHIHGDNNFFMYRPLDNKEQIPSNDRLVILSVRRKVSAKLITRVERTIQTKTSFMPADIEKTVKKCVFNSKCAQKLFKWIAQFPARLPDPNALIVLEWSHLGEKGSYHRSELKAMATVKGLAKVVVSPLPVANELIAKSCTVCIKPARHRCSGCSKVYYCSVEHQRSDWQGTHKIACSAKVRESMVLLMGCGLGWKDVRIVADYI